jgi:hypothetical protein
MSKGLLLNSDFDLLVVNGSSRIGNASDQDAAIVLQLQQGDLKEDPLLGPGLTRFIRGKYNSAVIEQRMRVHFTRAGLNYEDFKDRITTSYKTSE